MSLLVGTDLSNDPDLFSVPLSRKVVLPTCAAFDAHDFLFLNPPSPRPTHSQVYIGGAVDEADRMVASGKAKRDDFKFMLHLCGWAPGQLEAEIERGVWLSVATSANVSQKRTSEQHGATYSSQRRYFTPTGIK